MRLFLRGRLAVNPRISLPFLTKIFDLRLSFYSIYIKFSQILADLSSWSLSKIFEPGFYFFEAFWIGWQRPRLQFDFWPLYLTSKFHLTELRSDFHIYWIKRDFMNSIRDFDFGKNSCIFILQRYWGYIDFCILWSKIEISRSRHLRTLLRTASYVSSSNYLSSVFLGLKSHFRSFAVPGFGSGVGNILARRRCMSNTLSPVRLFIYRRLP